MRVISKLHDKCEKCPHVNDCDEKRMVACGLAELPEKMNSPLMNSAANSAQEEMMVKHDLRHIKVGPTQTITIDLEDVKKDLKREFYRAIGCPSLQSWL